MKGFYEFVIAGTLSVGLTATVSAQSVVLGDGMLVDQQVVYTMKPGGGIEALAVADGRVLWVSAQADRPVMARDGRVLAQRASRQRGELLLQFLDAASGAPQAGQTVRLPGNVLSSVDDRIDSRFSISVEDGASTDLIWRYEHRPAQGMLDAGGGAPAVQRAGILRAGFDTLEVESAARAAPTRPAYDRVAQVDFAGKTERAFYSEDRRHVLVSRRVDGTTSYQWRLHDTGGALLGQWISKVSFTPFVVRAGRALFVSTPGVSKKGDTLAVMPLQLTAVDVASGDTVWAREVRDTRYTGPMAP